MKNCATSNFHNSLILCSIFIKFALFCLYFIALFTKLKVDLTGLELSFKFVMSSFILSSQASLLATFNSVIDVLS